jgi:hypothetical protein
MPREIINRDPERFFDHQGVVIYCAYLYSQWDCPLPFRFTTDVDEGDEYEFDLRTLEVDVPLLIVNREPTRASAEAVLRAAIEQGLLKLPPPRPSRKTYTISWAITLDAKSYEDAARQALGTMQDPESLATFLTINGPEGTIARDYHDVLGREDEDDDASDLP